MLITLLSISLAACGNSQQTAGEQPTAEEQQTGSKDVFSNLPGSVTCVVQISINPEFEVHVNDDGVIENVICLNDDAQAICSVLNITGKNYKDGVMELLTTAYNQGYITQDSRVSIVAARKFTAKYDVPFATDEIVSEFTANVVSIGFDIQNETINEEEQKETQSTSESSVESTTDRPDSIIDENGNQVLYTYHDNGQCATVEVVRPDGSSQKTFYDKDGIIYEEHVEKNTERGIMKYENGVVTSDERQYADGTYVLSTFNKNGLPAYSETRHTDGGIYIINYDNNGIPVTAKITYPDGIWVEQIFKNGRVYIENEYGLTPEGHTIKNTFHPNGKIAETVDYYAHNGQEVIYRYDENGTMTEWLHYDNYGRRIHTVYNADGTSVSVRTNEDGSTTVLD